MKRFLISFTAVLMAVVLCCSVGFASAPDENESGDIDMGALSAALGLSEEELEKLTEGELDVSDIDLGQVDLGAVVEAVGMTQEEALEVITEGMDADVDLNGSITRLDFCKVAAKAAGLTAQPAANPFTDCNDTSVLALVNAGVINGMTETTFAPNETLTRAQIAKIIFGIITK